MLSLIIYNYDLIYYISVESLEPRTRASVLDEPEEERVCRRFFSGLSAQNGGTASVRWHEAPRSSCDARGSELLGYQRGASR